MREAIGGTWLLGLVLTFIVFFASFLAVSINYSKAFNVKNNVVDLISKYEGNSPCTRKKISNYLNQEGYLIPGVCPTGYQGYDLLGNEVDVSKDVSKKAYYCIVGDATTNITKLDKKFYRVVIFFKIDLPMVGDITTFRIKGETESIYFANENTNC